MNLLVNKNLVRGLPMQNSPKMEFVMLVKKGKERKASFKSKTESSIDEPLQMLHMNLFGPVNIMSISKKKYLLVIVDDFTRFSWIFFLHSKDEASQLIINHIKVVNNDSKWNVKKIRSNNGTEFKNSIMKEFCNEK